MTDAPSKGPEYRKKMKRKIRRLVADRLGTPDVEEDGGTKLLRYGKDGDFDYDLYKLVQELGNKQKLTFQWVPQAHIDIIAADIARHIPNATTGLCHGTRRGKEQAWFMSALPGTKVLGTEISKTATDFPDTIQWDFHEVRDDWRNATDFIYSNSWDHTYDPTRLFPAWVSCLKPGGRMYLDHSRDQSGRHGQCARPLRCRPGRAG